MNEFKKNLGLCVMSSWRKRKKERKKFPSFLFAIEVHLHNLSSFIWNNYFIARRREGGKFYH